MKNTQREIAKRLAVRVGAVLGSLFLIAGIMTLPAATTAQAAPAHCRDFLALTVDGTNGHVDDHSNTPWVAEARWAAKVGADRVEAHGVAYPMSAANYDQSYRQGVTNMTNTVNDYLRGCPSSKVIMFGFSQGADVIGTYLNRKSIAVSALLGAALYGDPRFNPFDDSSYDANGYTRKGMWGARAAYPSTYRSSIWSLCNRTDQVCSSYNLPSSLNYLGGSHSAHSGYANSAYSPFGTSTSAIDWTAARFTTSAASSPRVYNKPAPAVQTFAARVAADTQRMSDPTLQSTLIGWYAAGSTIQLVCARTGQSVLGYYSPWIPGRWDNLWYKTTDGSWTADVDIYTGTNSTVTPWC